jgi:hypothetical protein
MLISMPTGTSTIFGVFQVIRVSQVVWRDVRRTKGRTASGSAQVLALTLREVPDDFFSTSSDICGNIQLGSGARP